MTNSYCNPHESLGMTLDMMIEVATGDPITVNLTVSNFEFRNIDTNTTGSVTLNPGSILRISPLSTFHNLDNLPWA